MLRRAIFSTSQFVSLTPTVNQNRGVRLNIKNKTPYDTRVEITTEKSRDPFSWDIPDLRNVDKDEVDILYKTVDIETRSHDDAVLNSYQKFLLATTEYLGIKVSSIFKPQLIAGINIDNIKWRRTLLRSAHVHKKARVQYETRTYYRIVQVKHLTGSTADTFLEYIQRNLPEGVAMKVTKCQSLALPSFLKPPS